MNDPSNAYGVIQHVDIPGRTDYLFRISLKALVFNDKNEVLLVKEAGRDMWDIPGGGVDHGETIKDVIRRELEEEVNLKGDFTYRVILAESPTFVESIKIWQMRIIFAVWPENTDFSAGEDGDEIWFAHPEKLKESTVATESIIAHYAELAGAAQAEQE
ncbi:hypothetical protein CMN24_04315 [Candidatus Saccharibacteria bacterium]|nr:hypothetical protein [Candidatus Saccharibacteria bacterium]